MAESMTEVQQRTVTLLALITSDDLGLYLARPMDYMRKGRRIASKQPVHMRFEPREKSSVADQPVFDDLSEPGTQLTRRQARQRARVCQNQDRLVERADEILAARVVHSCFATHRRIHLREEGRRYLHERNAALITGRSETGHIANDTAAERHDRAITPKAIRDEDVQNARDSSQGLVRLTVRQDDLDHTSRSKGSGQRIQIERRNRRITNDQHIARRDVLAQELGLAEKAIADQDGIATTA
jgi:hypothetical protein